MVGLIAHIFEEQKINIEHIPDSIDTVSIILKDEELEDKLEVVIENLREVCELSGRDKLNVDRDISLITVVGRNMAYTPGIVAKIFTALASKNINVRTINQGSSEINVIIGVLNKDYEKATRAIYNAFFSEQKLPA